MEDRSIEARGLEPSFGEIQRCSNQTGNTNLHFVKVVFGKNRLAKNLSKIKNRLKQGAYWKQISSSETAETNYYVQQLFGLRRLSHVLLYNHSRVFHGHF